MVDKGFVAPLPPSSKEEKVQKEPWQEEDPHQMEINEVLKEEKMVEYSQQAF